MAADDPYISSRSPTLLRLISIWLTSAVYFVTNSQAQTTFSGGTTTWKKSFHVFLPSTSLYSLVP